MSKKSAKEILKKTWHFIWEDDSLLSWIVNVLLAFVIIKFLIYPGIGFALGTDYPIVAVVSGSMEHDGTFDEWWSEHEQTYNSYGITKEGFQTYKFSNGFDKGDIMILGRASHDNLDVGDVLVFYSLMKPEPIIHRIVEIRQLDGIPYYSTKGDHNAYSSTLERDIPIEDAVGKALIRIPYLGYIKIAFVCTLDMVPGIETMPDSENFFQCLG